MVLPADSPSAPAEPDGTVSNAQGAVSTAAAVGWTFIAGTTIVLDPAGAPYTAIGASNLGVYVQGQDDVGHAALTN